MFPTVGVSQAIIIRGDVPDDTAGALRGGRLDAPLAIAEGEFLPATPLTD
jgi:hypothetical protein